MESLLKMIYDTPKRRNMLKNIGHISVALGVVLAVMCGFVVLARQCYKDFSFLFSSVAIGFIFVSVFRKIVNKPRPYEVYSFYEEKPKNKKGQSFPSRHTYSAAALAVIEWYIHPVCFIGGIILSAAVGGARVLTGCHFVKDVIVGALLGAFFGGVGLTLALVF